MCRFSDSLRPPAQPVDGLAELLDDADDFNWFDAIDELDEELLGLPSLPAVAGQLQTQQQQLPTPQSDSSAAVNAEQRFGAAPDTSLCSTMGAVGDSASSYDLVEMFKQQVEQQQQPAGLQQVPSGVSQFVAGAAPAAVSPSPFAVAAGGMMLPQHLQQQQLLVAAPYAALAPPQLLPAFLPAAALAAAPAGMSMLSNNNTVGTPSSAAAAATTPMQVCMMDTSAAAAPCRSGSATTNMPSANISCGSGGPGRRPRGQRSQAEIDAAVERIKQKRRESAQRSRARKNDYMHQLELENQALKDEVTRLQQVLAAVQRTTFQQQHQMAAGFVQLGAM